MSEIIVKLKQHHVKIKGCEYVRDLVRCEDCLHCCRNDQVTEDMALCYHHAMVVTPDYFCADGEEGEWMP